MNADQIFNDIRRQLKSKAKKKVAVGAERFFKEQIWVYGVQTSEVRRIAKEYAKRFKSDGDMKTAFRVAEKLLASSNMEEGVTAIWMLRQFTRYFDPSLFSLFHQWVNYLTNWAHTDGLSAWLIGDLVRKDPSKIQTMMKWTSSRNRWRRRAAAVALIPLAKDGRSLREILRLANRLMMDNDDMVQKGVGWLLKETSEPHPDEIVRHLQKWKGRTSGVTMRYACEKLSTSRRKLLINVRQ